MSPGATDAGQRQDEIADGSAANGQNARLALHARDLRLKFRKLRLRFVQFAGRFAFPFEKNLISVHNAL
jgi:hypothetical protein